MYAHQIIEDNIRFRKTKEMKELDKAFTYYSDLFINFVKKSTQFHLENIDSAESFMKEKDDLCYLQGLEEFRRLPYPITYIDFPVENEYGRTFGVTKKALLCMQHEQFNIYADRDKLAPDGCVVQAFSYSPSLKLWLMDPLRYNIDLEEGFTCAMHAYKNVGEQFKITEEEKLHDVEGAFSMMILNFFLMLLHCKNIQAVDQNPSNLINSQRRQQHKVPLFTYKTLHIIPFGSSKNKKDYIKHGDHNRVHMCRGHYRRYTEEAPLFGKHIGMYWIPDHARGKNKSGIIVKDYEIHPEN